MERRGALRVCAARGAPDGLRCLEKGFERRHADRRTSFSEKEIERRETGAPENRKRERCEMFHECIRILCSVLTFVLCMQPVGMVQRPEAAAASSGQFYAMGLEAMLQEEAQRVWDAAAKSVQRSAAATPQRALLAVLSGESFGRFRQNYSPHLTGDQRDMYLLCRLSGVVLCTDREAVETALRVQSCWESG